MFGDVWGEVPARVLALHGWARTHGDFHAALGPRSEPDPSAPLDVAAPDLPGFGTSPPPPEPWGTAAYAVALVPLFADAAPLARTPAVVVGHSFGGRVAIQLAATRPDLVAGLVLSGVPLLARTGRRRRPALGFRVVRGLRRAKLVGEERMERARQRHGSPDYRSASGVMRGVLVKAVGEDYHEQLSLLAGRRCPVELVWADDDSEAPVEVAEKAAALLPGAVLTRCPGAGHFTPLTAPEALRAAVERVLARATL